MEQTIANPDQALQIEPTKLNLNVAVDQLYELISELPNQDEISEKLEEAVRCYMRCVGHRIRGAGQHAINHDVMRQVMAAFSFQWVTKENSDETIVILVNTDNECHTPPKRAIVYLENRDSVKVATKAVKKEQATGYRMVKVDELLVPVIAAIKIGRGKV